jgi:hypothetical protein
MKMSERGEVRVCGHFVVSSSRNDIPMYHYSMMGNEHISICQGGALAYLLQSSAGC